MTKTPQNTLGHLPEILVVTKPQKHTKLAHFLLKSMHWGLGYGMLEANHSATWLLSILPQNPENLIKAIQLALIESKDSIDRERSTMGRFLNRQLSKTPYFIRLSSHQFIYICEVTSADIGGQVLHANEDVLLRLDFANGIAKEFQVALEKQPKDG